MGGHNRTRKMLLQAVKIAIGSSAAIYLAGLWHLQFETSAGSIALLTLVTTKWETLRLSIFRLTSFVFTAVLAWIAFTHLRSSWIAYGIFIFLLVVISQLLGWQATISVNAVIGSHFLMAKDFGMPFIYNEFLLVLIGVSIAVVLNLFHDNRSLHKRILKNVGCAESHLQMILQEVAAYLSNRPTKQSAWEDIRTMEKELLQYMKDAREYQDNTFRTHTVYYSDYFEMRMRQCEVLYNLHYEMHKLKQVPERAGLVAEYVLYLAEFVSEMNEPTIQIEKLHDIFDQMKRKPLPETWDEFESIAVLHHILMDLEEFLLYKMKFVQSLDEKQMRRYWKVAEK